MVVVVMMMVRRPPNSDCLILCLSTQVILPACTFSRWWSQWCQHDPSSRCGCWNLRPRGHAGKEPQRRPREMPLVPSHCKLFWPCSGHHVVKLKCLLRCNCHSSSVRPIIEDKGECHTYEGCIIKVSTVCFCEMVQKEARWFATCRQAPDGESVGGT